MNSDNQLARDLRRFGFWLMLVYFALGSFGVIWFSDAWDHERGLFFSLVVIPLTFVFLAVRQYYPKGLRLYRRTAFIACGILVTGYSWGVLMVLNHLGREEKTEQAVTVDQPSLPIAHYRGGLGWLYRQRW